VARIDDLRDLRGILREALDEASVGVKAQIAAQYRATLAEIDELEKASAPAAPEGTGLDELNQRRAARAAGTARPA
jgi:hypothetical protein